MEMEMEKGCVVSQVYDVSSKTPNEVSLKSTEGRNLALRTWEFPRFFSARVRLELAPRTRTTELLALGVGREIVPTLPLQGRDSEI